MPVKLSSRLPIDNAEARIEIIPLIDIMFFLLAAFMLVSLSMVNLKGVRVNLPTAAVGSAEPAAGMVHISVDEAGLIFLDQRPVGPHELAEALAGRRATNATLRVCISGDRDARHGDMIGVLDLVRSAGIDKVAFRIHPSASPATP